MRYIVIAVVLVPFFIALFCSQNLNGESVIYLNVSVKLNKYFDRNTDNEVSSAYNFDTISGRMTHLNGRAGELTLVASQQSQDPSVGMIEVYEDKFKLSFPADDNTIMQLPKTPEQMSQGFPSENQSNKFVDHSATLTFLSKEGIEARLVSGVEVSFDSYTSPKCWIQYRERESGSWFFISESGQPIIPLHVMDLQSGVTDTDCSSVLVNAWGRKVIELTIRFSNR